MKQLELDGLVRDREYLKQMLNYLETEVGEKVVTSNAIDHCLKMSGILYDEFVRTHHAILSTVSVNEKTRMLTFEQQKLLERTVKLSRSMVNLKDKFHTEDEDVKIIEPIPQAQQSPILNRATQKVEGRNISELKQAVVLPTYHHPPLSSNSIASISSKPSLLESDREIFYTALRKLTNHPPLQSSSYAELRAIVDVTKECAKSLEKLLEINIKNWDGVLCFHLAEKLAAALRKEWEGTLTSNKIPELGHLLKFLENRVNNFNASPTIHENPQVFTHNHTIQNPQAISHPIYTPNSGSSYKMKNIFQYCGECYVVLDHKTGQRCIRGCISCIRKNYAKLHSGTVARQ